MCWTACYQAKPAESGLARPCCVPARSALHVSMSRSMRLTLGGLHCLYTTDSVPGVTNIARAGCVAAMERARQHV